MDLLEGQVRELDGSLAREFVFRPTVTKPAAGGGASFVPAAVKSELHAPVVALPSVGRLVVVGKTRHLAITDWAHLDAAEQEATRLAASLVADLEGA